MISVQQNIMSIFFMHPADNKYAGIRTCRQPGSRQEVIIWIIPTKAQNVVQSSANIIAADAIIAALTKSWQEHMRLTRKQYSVQIVCPSAVLLKTDRIIILKTKAIPPAECITAQRRIRCIRRMICSCILSPKCSNNFS